MDLRPETKSVITGSGSYWACGHFLKIYTEWVNSHLEKRNRRSHRPLHERRLIRHLPTDLSDGILLAEVIQAVTDHDKEIELNVCPQDLLQKVENIERCLRVLTALDIKTEQVAASDIQKGDLSAIFGLLFALSRFKQQKTASCTTDFEPTGQRSRALGAVTHGSTPCLETSTSSSKLWQTSCEKRKVDSLCTSETNIVQWSASSDCRPLPPLPLVSYVARQQKRELTETTHLVSAAAPLKTTDAQRPRGSTEADENYDYEDGEPKQKTHLPSLTASSSFPLISVAGLKQQQRKEKERNSGSLALSHPQISVASSTGVNQTSSEVCEGEVDRVTYPSTSTPVLNYPGRPTLQGRDVNHNISSIEAAPQNQTTCREQATPVDCRSIDPLSVARCRSGTREPVIYTSWNREPASGRKPSERQVDEGNGDLLDSKDMSKIALLLRSGKMRSTAEEEANSRDSPSKNSRQERTAEANGNNTDGGESLGGNGFQLVNGRQHQNAPRENAGTAFAPSKANGRKTTRNAGGLPSTVQETNGNRLSTPVSCSSSPADGLVPGNTGGGQGNKDPGQKQLTPVHPVRSGQAKEGGRQAVRLDSDRILVSPTDDRRGASKCSQPKHGQKQSLDGSTVNGITKLTMQSEDGGTSKQPHIHSSASSTSSSSASSKSVGRNVSSRCLSKGASVNADSASSVDQRSGSHGNEGKEATAGSRAANVTVVDLKRSLTGENIGSRIPIDNHASHISGHVGTSSMNGYGENSVKLTDSTECSCRDSIHPQIQQPVNSSRARMLSDVARSPRTEAKHDEDSSSTIALADDQRDSKRQRHEDKAIGTEVCAGEKSGGNGRDENGMDGSRSDDAWNGLQLKAMQPIASRHFHHPFPSGPRPSPSYSSSTSDSARIDSSRNSRHPPHHPHALPPPSRMDLYAVTEGCPASPRMLSLVSGQRQVRRRATDAAAADSGYSSDSGAIYSRWMNHQTRPLHRDALRTVRECIENPSLLADSVSDCRLLDSLALSEKKSNRSKMFGQSQSGVSSSGVKSMESSANSHDQNASHCLADGRWQEHGEYSDPSWHRYCLVDKRNLASPPAQDDINRVTLPRTHGKVRTGQWLRSGLGSETTSKEVPADSMASTGDDDLRTAEMMLPNSDRLLRQESPDSDAKRRPKCSSHCRSPSLVTFSAKDDKTFHSTHQQHQHQQQYYQQQHHQQQHNQQQHYQQQHHQHQQRRGSGDGQKLMVEFEQRELASCSSPLSTITHDGQKRINPLRLLSTEVTRQSDCAGTNDQLSEERCSDPDLVKREKSDGSTQKVFDRRLQAIGSSIDAARANRLDYCNSLPRVSRARRSESVGCGTRRDGGAAVGRGSTPHEVRYSFGSSFSELKSFLTGSTSLPTTPRRSLSRDDDSDVHASLLSLISSASSVYSTAEEKQAQEIRKLKTELEVAHEKINTLTMQLNANVHVVTAFEQSLSSMTHRLQKLTNSSEQKDQELNNLKTTLHQLQQQSSNARAEMLMQRAVEQPLQSTPFANSYRLNHPDFSGLSALNTNHRNMVPPPPSSSSTSSCDRDTRSHLSLMSIASSSSSCSSSATPSVQYPSITSHETTTTSAATTAAAATSSSSGCERKPKKKGWLSTSFTKAFSRKKSKDLSDTEGDVMSTSFLEASSSVPNSPLLGTPGLRSVPSTPLALPRRTIDSTLPAGVTMQQQQLPELELRESEVILQLKQQLHEKDMKLTDIRLEALSSTHQLEQLREAMNQMKMEMNSLKAENERMQNLITEKGIVDPSAAAANSTPLKMHANPTINTGTSSSSNSPNSSVSSSSLLKKSLVLGEPSHFDSLSMESTCKDAASPRYTVAVHLGPWTQNDAKPPSSPASVPHSMTNATPRQVLIGTVGLTSTTKWETLDSTVRRIFKEHVCRLDPGSGLGLNGESVLCYHVGEITRTKGSKMPELLPCGYLVGHHTTIILSLRGVHERSLDSLSFETLVPKTVAQRYISLLVEHKRLVICGPSGIGKTYLAAKLAEYLVVLSGRDVDDDSAISTFSIDSKSSRELKQYLSSIADRCHSKERMTEGNSTGSRSRELPVVIVVDNLQHVASFEDTFSTFLDFNCKNCPYIIGTMISSTSSAASAVNSLHPVHHGFRWVLLTTQTEPVRSFLCRHLQRRLVEQEVASNTRSGQLTRIVDWLAQAWLQLNKFLTEEMHSSTERSLGTRLFSSCPMDVHASEEWFADLWNYSIVPFLLEAIKEQQHQQQQVQGESSLPPTSQMADPTLWVIDSYPWPLTDRNKDRPALLRLRPNDSEDNGTSRTQQQQQQWRQDRMNPSVSPDATNCLRGQRKTSLTSKDPLMTMLERLKEAANETGSTPANSSILDLH